ncbi:unnamed protein product [Symbiodinium sp. CCMP2592]|nr:unnamed protein product [Symbiodinium sp. CCMP2592]
MDCGMDVQTPVRKKRSSHYLAETAEKDPRPRATTIDEAGDEKRMIHAKDGGEQKVHPQEKDPKNDELLELEIKVVDGETFFTFDGKLYKVEDPKALQEVNRAPLEQAKTPKPKRSLSDFRKWYANRRGVF